MTGLICAVMLNLGGCARCGSPETSDSEPSAEPVVEQAASDDADSSAVTPSRRHVLLLGIDGATWDLMDPLLEAGKLPHFAKLIAAGTRAPLKSFEPTASPLIWTTIATGVPPEVHGIEDFTVESRSSKEMLLPTSNLRRVKAFWNILSDFDVSVGVVGWWASYPAEAINGFVISDQANTVRNKSYETALGVKNLAEKRSMTHPPSLAEAIAETMALPSSVPPNELSRFFVMKPEELKKIADSDALEVEDLPSIFKFAYLIDRSFVDSSLLALRRRKPQVMALYLNGLDAAEHHFWKFMAPKEFPAEKIAPADIKKFGRVIEAYHLYMDEVLGQLLKYYDTSNATILVMSDHGHHKNPTHDPKDKSDHYNRVCSGGHEDAPDGIFIAAGADVRAGLSKLSASVYDIAPTLLALAGVPIDEKMTGRVLTELIEPSFLERHPVTAVKNHSEGWKYDADPVPSAMSEALKTKLKALGYIE